MLWDSIAFKKSFFRDFLNLTSGYALSQSIILLFSPLLTRLYSPEEFGIFYFFVTTGSILSVVATGGYEKAVVLAKNEKDSNELFFSSIILLFCTALISLLVCAVLYFGEGHIFRNKIEKKMLWMVPIYAFFFGIFRLIQNANIRHRQFRDVASSYVNRSASLSVFQAGWGLAGLGSFGLILGSCIGQIIPVILQTFKKGLHADFFSKNMFTNSMKKAKEYAEFPLYRMPSDIMNEFSIQAPLYVLKTIFNNSIAGLYTFPQKILYQPSKFISQAVADVFFNKASELYNRGKNLSELTLSIYKNLFIIGILPYLCIVLWGPEMFSFIFGKDWEVSGRIASYLSPWMFLVFVGSPISSIFIVAKKLRFSFYMNLILLVFRICSLLVGGLIFNDAELMIMLFSTASVLYWIVSILFSLHYSKADLLKIVLFSLFVTLIALAILLPLKLIY